MNSYLSWKYLCLHIDDFLVKYISKLIDFVGYVGQWFIECPAMAHPCLPQVSGSHVYNESTEPEKYSFGARREWVLFSDPRVDHYNAGDELCTVALTSYTASFSSVTVLALCILAFLCCCPWHDSFMTHGYLHYYYVSSFIVYQAFVFVFMYA